MYMYSFGDFLVDANHPYVIFLEINYFGRLHA